MDLSSWHYFLSLERDFERSINYVELTSRNGDTFSNEYAKLLLLIGSEVDVVAKTLCRALDPSSTASNIMHYRETITSAFQGMHEIEIDIPRYQMSVRPWGTWGLTEPTSPDWWKSYNSVKHDRVENFDQANLSNTVQSLAGLLALHLYLHRDDRHLQPYPELLAFAFPAFIVNGGNGKKLPGVN
ncbi:hypothetical protein [Mesorhizobium sp. B2-3-5]|uniref:hypothetical protein n=1 Tax=Mesorhizobium sp. B2-3-5 TaxID=2589958 RepID=UPI00112C21D8|nr:hypothetical protein [Mesorhizobium sp. B2-3-5]TPM32949.1 hypothetical protein FJ958_09350 [Mesorhizobium sp. B2-3-5]